MMYSILNSVIAAVPFLRAMGAFRAVGAAMLIMVMVIQPVSASAEPLGVSDVLNIKETIETPAPVAGPAQPPTIQEVLLQVCEKHGYGEDCAKVLLGMAWKETNFKGTAIGDRGQARGWFQIWPKHHAWKLKQIMEESYPEITTVVGCAEDLRCSAEWTIWYLEKNSYPKYVNYAIQCHNGCNINNGYAASVQRHAARLWDNTTTLAYADGTDAAR